VQIMVIGCNRLSARFQSSPTGFCSRNLFERKACEGLAQKLSDAHGGLSSREIGEAMNLLHSWRRTSTKSGRVLWSLREAMKKEKRKDGLWA